ESKCAGFVTTATLQKLMGRVEEKKIEYCYLSDDIEDITLGADPVFALVNPETTCFKYAEQIAGFSKTGLLGADGPLAELRPPPDNSTAGVVENIRKILARGNKYIEKYNWIAGATYHSPLKSSDRVLHIGGHVHLGDPLVLP